MAHYRDFDIEMTIVPDAAGQYEAAFLIHEARGAPQADKQEDSGGDGPGDEQDQPTRNRPSGQQDAGRSRDAQSGDARGGRYAFPPVGSYLTPDDAREQTEAWARKWIDANFSK
ncbi:hypothetical protein AKI39_06500 [Bordetella sp. H567]|uniref:hypothetical protein n=1 Tax=Bordetella sp. H567 TaxID=1697043 RepID=UPI00081D2DAB|nr:hypothetical protein [Bordetella sp. H567]AOB30423.1 hypothetical protein AKI39_06500 [Bordetella sp. H567]